MSQSGAMWQATLTCDKATRAWLQESNTCISLYHKTFWVKRGSKKKYCNCHHLVLFLRRYICVVLFRTNDEKGKSPSARMRSRFFTGSTFLSKDEHPQGCVIVFLGGNGALHARCYEEQNSEGKAHKKIYQLRIVYTIFRRNAIR